MDTIEIERTKLGFPGIWESGGYNPASRIGKSIAVCRADGTPFAPVFKNKFGKAKNKNHALFIVSIGDIIAQTTVEMGMERTVLYRITEISRDVAYLFEIAEAVDRVWDSTVDPRYSEVITASRVIANTSNYSRVAYGLTE